MISPDQILFEDNHLIVINKKPGEIVQGDKTGDLPLNEQVKLYIKKKYQKPGNVFIGTIHRLDRPASGIVVFARTSKALSRMNEIFRDKKLEKYYWAIVKERPVNERGHLIHYLIKNEKQNKSYAYDSQKNGTKKAELSYELIGSLEKYHLLEINLITGRHHQIRTQLSKIGSPIRGDLKYGFDRSNQDGSINLHAQKIVFNHPVTKENLTILANPPEDKLWHFFKGAIT